MSRARLLSSYNKALRTDVDRTLETNVQLAWPNNQGIIQQVMSAGSTVDPAQQTVENLLYASSEALVIGPAYRPDIYQAHYGPTDTVFRKYDIGFQEGISDAWVVTEFGGGYAGTHDLIIGTGGAILEMTTGANAAQDGVRYWQQYAAMSLGPAAFIQAHIKADIGNVELEFGLMGGTGTTPDPSDRLSFYRQDTGASATHWFARSVVGGGAPTDVDTGKTGVAVDFRRTFIIAIDTNSNAKFYIGNNANNDPEYVGTIEHANLSTATLHPFWQIRSVTSAVNKLMYINNGQMKFGY